MVDDPPAAIQPAPAAIQPAARRPAARRLAARRPAAMEDDDPPQRRVRKRGFNDENQQPVDLPRTVLTKDMTGVSPDEKDEGKPSRTRRRLEAAFSTVPMPLSEQSNTHRFAVMSQGGRKKTRKHKRKKNKTRRKKKKINKKKQTKSNKNKKRHNKTKHNKKRKSKK